MNDGIDHASQAVTNVQHVASPTEAEGDVNAARRSGELPMVSVIVPVRNAAANLRRCLSRVLEQRYPADRVEVIVVDNGSTDATREVAVAFPVQLYSETSIESPYAARNLGIGKARGDVVVLIDAGCEPTNSDWLVTGVRALLERHADIVAGRAIFTFSSQNTLAEQIDSLSNQNMRDSVARGVAKGSNLFIQRGAFDKIGPFPVERSGGDVRWTGRATAAGLKLVYDDDAAVYYPARRFRALLKKQVRVGHGQCLILLEKGMTPLTLMLRTLAGFRPPSLRQVRSRVDNLGTPDMHRRLVRLWWVAWLVRVATMIGRLQYLAGRRREVPVSQPAPAATRAGAPSR